jgi:TRAP-type C4-dicarboxylate transport system permease small subunit
MIRFIDTLSAWMARLSAWMFFAIGLMVTWEVITRKVFNSPTIWVDETARFAQVWAVYLATAHILKRRDLIVVEIIPVEGHPLRRKLLDSITLAIIGVFSFVAMSYGFDILMESIRMGRHTSTMLGVPKWMTESSIPVGFGLLLAQVLAEFVKLWRGDRIPAQGHASGGEG